MRKWICVLLGLSAWLGSLAGQDTFSIVAVDTATGEVGSAGATCLDVDQEGVSAVIISDLLPGRGVIHTQSFWNPANQAAARARMENEDSPEQIIAWLQANDAQGDPSARQYGIADIAFNGTPRAAAFTGPNCFDEKGHRVGNDYAIQGNILISESVLDSMEARFLASEGQPLAQRLMEALQGANVPGADNRCLDEGVSSRSAFLRVARPGDTSSDPYLDLRVDATPFGIEPIDELQTLFDQWQVTSAGQVNSGSEELRITLFPNPTSGRFTLQANRPLAAEALIWSSSGQEVARYPFRAAQLVLERPPASGLYWVVIQDADGRFLKTLRLVATP